MEVGEGFTDEEEGAGDEGSAGDGLGEGEGGGEVAHGDAFLAWGDFAEDFADFFGGEGAWVADGDGEDESEDGAEGGADAVEIFVF